MDKAKLRRAMAGRKRDMTEADINAASARLAKRFLESTAYRQASALYAYMSFNAEVRTVPIIRQAWTDGRRVAIPRVEGRDMRFYWIDSFEDLETSAYGIPEPPITRPRADDAAALVLVPGLAFDRRGMRVGYGGGYYDRFLSEEPTHPTIALCYGFQRVDSISCQAHDLPVDWVIWDEGTA